MNKQCLLWAEGLQFKMLLMYGFLMEVNATAANMQYNHLVLRDQISVIHTVAPLMLFVPWDSEILRLLFWN